MTREAIAARFAHTNGVDQHGVRRSPVGPEGREVRVADLSDERGDHELNPDLLPDGDKPLIPAAVLVPLVLREEGLTVLLTQRTDHLANHPGQVSFPGGHIDEVDRTPECAALREAEEEIGLGRDRVDIIGRLDDYVTRTGFRVVPVVAFVRPPFSVDPDPFEVADVFEVPLDFLLDPRNHQRHSRIYQGRRRYFHAMPYGDFYIWGATAGMLMNLYEFLTGGD